MGRHSTFTQAIADAILEQLAHGIPLAEICRDENLPSVQTIYNWRDAHPDFAVAIARAREDGFDRIAADCLTIANTPMEGVEITTDTDGRVSEKRVDMLGHRKLQIETRLKLLAKWDPKRYGERLQTEHSGTVSLASLVEKAHRIRSSES
jgi:hypothetical protein